MKAVEGRKEKTMKRILGIGIAVALVLGTVTFTACDQLAQIASQAAQVLNLKNCNFSVNGINQINMLGINLSKGMDKSNLNATQIINVTNALLNKKLPVSFNVNIDVDNPNGIAATLGKMDYVIALNNREIISSTFNQGFSIPANSKGQVSIPITTDLFQLFSGETADASTWPSNSPVPRANPSTSASR